MECARHSETSGQQPAFSYSGVQLLPVCTVYKYLLPYVVTFALCTMETSSETDFDIGLRRMVEAFVTITWLALNLGLNLFNKWAFTPDDENFDGAGFTFPIFFTMWNMVCIPPSVQAAACIITAAHEFAGCFIPGS